MQWFLLIDIRAYVCSKIRYDVVWTIETVLQVGHIGPKTKTKRDPARWEQNHDQTYIYTQHMCFQSGINMKFEHIYAAHGFRSIYLNKWLSRKFHWAKKKQ